MRLLNFLNEKIVEASLSEENFYKLLKTKCSKTLKEMKRKKIYIYRGIRGETDKFLMFDGTKERESAYTWNHYTLLFSKILKSWKDIPKRDHALVCSTDWDKAIDYGTLYLVIPYDDTKIADSNKYDFWDIVKNSREFTLCNINILKKINLLFNELMVEDDENDIKKFLNKKVLDVYDSWKDPKWRNDINFNEIKIIMNLSVSYVTKNKSYSTIYTADKLDDIENHKDKLKNVTFYDVFNEFLSPKNLGIILNNNYQSLKNNDSEVWMDKPALLIQLYNEDSPEGESPDDVVNYLSEKI